MSDNASKNIVSISGLKQACKHCSLHDLCLPMGVDDSDLDALESLLKPRRPVQRNEHLYRAGDRLTSIYAVRSGSVKTYSLTNDGREQITGFHLPGELIGLDAINDNTHPCSARALETSSVCEMPFDQLEHLAMRIPGLQHQLFRIMSRELKSDEQFMTLLGKKNADERLASFLVGLSNRFKERGYSATEFNLSMSRNDIANYLGLAVETVSRLFSRLQDDGIMTVDRKLIHITDLSRLNQLAGVSCDKPMNRTG
ncbi:MAG TPA: fumarate/nitrate reduction transcriptional regulator Fnr [Thioalkalivibrio sp.]|nr:fumarate/nitrate reduction transcriptional regulator Fnr [Thioalkalivibrio sp.]